MNVAVRGLSARVISHSFHWCFTAYVWLKVDTGAPHFRGPAGGLTTGNWHATKRNPRKAPFTSIAAFTFLLHVLIMYIPECIRYATHRVYFLDWMPLFGIG